MSAALLVVDVQFDFIDGSLAIPGAAAIVPVINGLMDRVPLVVLAQDWHPAGHVSFASSHPGAAAGGRVATPYGEQPVHADHCVQGSPGAAFHPDLRTDRAALILRKGMRPGVNSYSAFHENDGTDTGLAAWLRARGVDHVVCTGLARYGCVRASAEGAAREGFAVTMVDDATAGRARPTDADASRALAEAGVVRTLAAGCSPQDG